MYHDDEIKIGIAKGGLVHSIRHELDKLIRTLVERNKGKDFIKKAIESALSQAMESVASLFVTADLHNLYGEDKITTREFKETILQEK
jgi:isocitrate dehydrogenase